MRLVKRFFLVCGVLIATVVVLAIPNYFFLWKPSLQGECLDSPQFRGPASTLPHLARFRGRVVGKNLWIFQYRWLRRRFTAVGTILSLERELPSTEYQGNIVLNSEKVADVVIDKSGSFDFGSLTPGEYGL